MKRLTQSSSLYATHDVIFIGTGGGTGSTQGALPLPNAFLRGSGSQREHCDSVKLGPLLLLLLLLLLLSCEEEKCVSKA